MFENVACCDDCWWSDRAGESPSWLRSDGIVEPLVPNGRGITEVGGFRLPMRFRQEMRREEFCHFCGWTTYSGIYVRIDTTEQPAASLRIRKES